MNPYKLTSKLDNGTPLTGEEAKYLIDLVENHEEEDKVFDCFDEGCSECTVCKYLSFIEWAESVGKPEGSVIQRNELVEDYLKRKDTHHEEEFRKAVEERDKEWLLYLHKWHRHAYDDLFDPNQDDRPILSADKIDRLTHEALTPITSNQDRV